MFRMQVIFECAYDSLHKMLVLGPRQELQSVPCLQL